MTLKYCIDLTVAKYCRSVAKTYDKLSLGINPNSWERNTLYGVGVLSESEVST